ncbi:MAG: FAD-dependent oxidoreductase [Treponema sp.]|nr:FAD-dependent oxidoreductase [Treponema sp.]
MTKGLLADAAIIGAGVVGTAIARELSKYDLKIVVVDKESDVSAGTSKANSGIVHAGYDPEENTLMAHLNAEGNKLFDTVCGELSVPFKRNGSLVLAFNDEQLSHINILKQRGIKNGIPGLSILSKEDLLKKEPSVNPEVKGALFVDTAGITDPMLLTISFMETAVLNGAKYLFDFCVESIEKEDGCYRIVSGNNSVSAKYVINAAGVYCGQNT